MLKRFLFLILFTSFLSSAQDSLFVKLNPNTGFNQLSLYKVKGVQQAYVSNVKSDNDTFKLSQVGVGSTGKNFYYTTEQYLNFNSSGVGTQTKYVIEALLRTGKFKVISLGGAVKHQDYTPKKVEQYGDDWEIFPIDGKFKK